MAQIETNAVQGMVNSLEHQLKQERIVLVKKVRNIIEDDIPYPKTLGDYIHIVKTVFETANKLDYFIPKYNEKGKAVRRSVILMIEESYNSAIKEVVTTMTGNLTVPRDLSRLLGRGIDYLLQTLNPNLSPVQIER